MFDLDLLAEFFPHTLGFLDQLKGLVNVVGSRALFLASLSYKNSCKPEQFQAACLNELYNGHLGRMRSI